MKIEVKNTCKDFNSYRANRVKSLFNADKGFEFRLMADIQIDDMDWGLGVIVGPSGSGKTSIGKKLFGGGKIIDLYANWDPAKPVIDCIAEDGDFNTVTGSLAAVGLGDVPAWLRPFSALSNGQQFRAGLARVMCDTEKEVIIDEFTSVVDRQIARIGAMAFAKSWKRERGRKCILLSCHYDIIEWLQPDWVYDTGTLTFKKKAKSEPDQTFSWTSGRSTSLTGRTLSHIII